MSEYRAPVKDMLFLLRHVVDFKSLPIVQAGELDDEMVEAILGEAGRLASEELAPLNAPADRQGAVLDGQSVKTADGFKEFYAKYRDNGWNGVPFDPEYGGQGLPWVLAFGTQEMWQSANTSFGLCPLLTQAAVEAISIYGTEVQKKTYLEKLISGEWAGTMNLTEPHAGSDLGTINSKAVKQDDGSYLISGQKIFITYGEHDMTDNIIHTVLARTPDAPEGTKGISMFIVPKFIPDENGTPGERNDVYVTGLEHKLGIHASPTCTLQYGDNGGATGYLVGQENEGLKYMFVMMNNARLSVGLQGVALSERAYQHAVSYAKERVQGALAGSGSDKRVPIIEHADIKRMLLTMKALTQAGRAIAYEAVLALDLSADGSKEDKIKAELLTPVVKAWCTDRSVDVASLGVQVHGGMGFIEETGAAQFYRDARILPIYEGTNSIQAMDLHGRKILRDGGAFALDYIKGLSSAIDALDGEEFAVSKDMLSKGLSLLEAATKDLIAMDIKNGMAVNVPYLHLFGYVLGGVMMAKIAAAAKTQIENGIDVDFHSEKLGTASFYLQHILPQSFGLAECVTHGQDAVLGFPVHYFG